MNLEHLRAFVATVEERSVTAAARKLALSQPGVSRRIARLAREVGADLFVRDGGSLRLTPEGERVLRFAASTLEAEDDLHADLTARRTGVTGAIRIAASTVPAEQVVPPLLAAFLARHPLVAVHVEAADTSAVVEAVRRRTVDLGFCGYADPDERLRFFPIASDEIVAAVPQDHPLAESGEVAPAALSRERHIIREAGSGTQRTMDDALRTAGAQPPTQPPALSMGSTQAVIAAVRSGLGIGLVSRHALEGVTGVVGLRLEGVDARRSLYLVLERRRPRSPAAAALIGHIDRSRASSQSTPSPH